MCQDWKDYDWSDVTPLPVPDVPGQVAQIAYSATFLETMALFRAVSANNELSERVLALTTGVIEQNPAHYSVWDYRLKVCQAIGNEIFDHNKVGLTPESEEPPLIGDNGEWLNMFTLSHAKNYQVWNYRQHLLDPFNALWYQNEKLVIQMVLEDDTKNFHAWSHWKWCIGQGAIKCPAAFEPAELLRQIEQMIDTDVFNNSAWSFRYFLLTQFPVLRNAVQEAKYIFEQISKAPSNESAWTYLSGLVHSLMPELKEQTDVHVRLYVEGDPCARAVEFLAETSEPELAAKWYHKLAELEPVRREFWESLVQS